ncbi:MAG: LysR family transcriptional regulator [Alphaproteobacteria bacterium]|nr:LysR family transcriptional regulator [Alphaproteobacteria bacterium]
MDAAFKINKFYYKNNRLQQLRGFCYAAQFGNVTKAAKHMGLTQSTVSLQIKALEEEMGIKLFERNGPQIKLTHQGETLFDLSLPYVDGLQNLYETFHHELSIVQKTELHICVNSTTLNFIMPPIIKAFIQQNPHIYVTLHYAEHDEALEKLEQGVADLAVLPKREHKPFSKSFDYTPLFHYVPALITRPDHPLAGRRKLSVQEISCYELSLPAEDLRVIPNLYDIFPAHEINKKLRVNFVNWETTRKYIEAGLVISISSDVIIDKDNDTLVATPLSHLFPNAEYGFVTKRHKMNRKNSKLDKLMDVAKYYAPRLSTAYKDL